MVVEEVAVLAAEVERDQASLRKCIEESKGFIGLTRTLLDRKAPAPAKS